MIFTQLSNASFRFSLRLLGAELEGGGSQLPPPPRHDMFGGGGRLGAG